MTLRVLCALPALVLSDSLDCVTADWLDLSSYYNQDAVAEVHLPCLETATWGIEVGEEPPETVAPRPRIRILDLPVLTEADSLYIRDATELASVMAPNLESLGDLAVIDAPALTTLDLGRVAALDAGGLSTVLDHTGLRDLGCLASVTRSANIHITNNDFLTDVSVLRGIEIVESTPSEHPMLQISGNGALADCDAVAVWDAQMAHPAGLSSWNLCDNLADACTTEDCLNDPFHGH